MKPTKVFLVLAMLLGVLCINTFVTSVAHASPYIQSPGHLFFTNISISGKAYTPGLTVEIGPNVDTTISKSWTSTNSYGGSIGVEKSIASAELKFDVSESTTWSVSCHFANTSNIFKTMYFDNVFDTYTYKIYYHYDSTFFGMVPQDVYEGNGWANKATGYSCDTGDTPSFQ